VDPSVRVGRGRPAERRKRRARIEALGDLDVGAGDRIAVGVAQHRVEQRPRAVGQLRPRSARHRRSQARPFTQREREHHVAAVGARGGEREVAGAVRRDGPEDVVAGGFGTRVDPGAQLVPREPRRQLAPGASTDGPIGDRPPGEPGMTIGDLGRDQLRIGAR
jgi:hypothetical protein